MFQYYKDAYQCHVYLEDLGASEDCDLGSCRWFTRSWTLQELIAPKTCVFYNQNWVYIGDKINLAHDLAPLTGIDKDVLFGRSRIAGVSIATRMSWAAGRKATREEDIAYSLLGLFDVNMPLLYGEGSKAFIRLQEEIMKESNDQSLFAWGTINQAYSEGYSNGRIQVMEYSQIKAQHMVFQASMAEEEGFLALSPDYFETGSNIMSYTTDRDHTWIITNKGIQVSFPMLHYNNIDLFLLNCYIGSDLGRRIAIASKSGPGNVRKRARVGILLVENSTINQVIQYDQQFFWLKNEKLIATTRERENGVFVDIDALHGWEIYHATPAQSWDEERRIFSRPDHSNHWCVGLSIRFSAEGLSSEGAVVYICGFIEGAEFGCRITDRRDDWFASLNYDSRSKLPEFAAPNERKTEVRKSNSAALANPSFQKAAALRIRQECTEVTVQMASRDVMGQQMYVLQVREAVLPPTRTLVQKGRDAIHVALLDRDIAFRKWRNT